MPRGRISSESASSKSLCVFRVDRHHDAGPEVKPAAEIRFGDLGGELRRLPLHLLRERERKGKPPCDAEHLDAGVARGAEHFDDLPLGIPVLVQPGKQLRDDFVSVFRPRGLLARDVHVAPDALVVRHHECRVGSLLQPPGHGGRGPLDDIDNFRLRKLARIGLAARLGAREGDDSDGVAVECGAEKRLRDEILLLGIAGADDAAAAPQERERAHKPVRCSAGRLFLFLRLRCIPDPALLVSREDASVDEASNRRSQPPVVLLAADADLLRERFDGDGCAAMLRQIREHRLLQVGM